MGLDYRHPMPFQPNQLMNVDCMLLNSVAVENLPYFDEQIQHFLKTMQQCLHSNPNAKLLLPVQPNFILEIVDLLMHKIDERVKIIFMSDSA